LETSSSSLSLASNKLSHCHHLKQGGNKQSGRWSLLTPALPPEEGKKEEKGERGTYKMNTKIALLITLIILLILIIRQMKQNIQN